MLGSPKQYDGQRVTVFATYRTGFETSELYCLSCGDRVWVEFDTSDNGQKAAKAVDRRLRRHMGTINGLFSGVFHDAGFNGYGHLSGWRYKISVDSVSELKPIEDLGLSPQALDSETRSKVCPNLR